MRYTFLLTIVILFVSTTTPYAQNSTKVAVNATGQENVLLEKAPPVYNGNARIHDFPVLMQPAEVTEVYTDGISQNERMRVRAENRAKKDNYNNELKYYQFGMPAGSYPHQIRQDLLKNKYGVDLLLMGCVPNDSMLYYNHTAERLLQKKYGDDFWKKVDQEVEAKAKAANWDWKR